MTAELKEILLNLCLKTNGCTPVINEDGSVSLISSETGEEVQNFTAPFAFDNAYVEGIEDNHYCADCRYDLKKLSDNEYILSVTVFRINGLTARTRFILLQLTLLQAIFQTILMQVYIRLNPQIIMVMSKPVASAEHRNTAMAEFIRILQCQRQSKICNNKQCVYLGKRNNRQNDNNLCYPLYMVTGSWSETAITWSNKPGYNSSTAMTKRTINSKSTDDSSNPYWYKFDIKTAVKNGQTVLQIMVLFF